MNAHYFAKKFWDQAESVRQHIVFKLNALPLAGHRSEVKQELHGQTFYTTIHVWVRLHWASPILSWQALRAIRTITREHDEVQIRLEFWPARV